MGLKAIIFFALALLATTHQRGSATVTSGEGIRCHSDAGCRTGYECILQEDGIKLCQRINCSTVARLCSDHEREEKKVCGSNGVTYSSLCAMRVTECETTNNIIHISDGECVTNAPPVKEITCTQMQQKFDTITMGDYLRLCPIEETAQKIENGTITLDDVKDCSQPQCTKEGDYTAKQCHLYYSSWCWCSTSDGVAIEGTLQENMQPGTCDMRAKCEYNGKTYRDGDVFTPISRCGFCECLNGSVLCSEDYITDDDDDADKYGKLTADQVNKLKEEILQVFYFQYQNSKHILADLREVRNHNIIVAGSVRTDILRWKFDHYDKNDDLSISSSEEHNFLTEVRNSFKCSHFEHHILSLIKNATHTESGISFSEWSSFFNRDHTETSSSAYALDPASSSSSSSGQNDDSDTSSGSSPSPSPIEAPAQSSGTGATPQAPEQFDNAAPVGKRSIPRRRQRFVYQLF